MTTHRDPDRGDYSAQLTNDDFQIVCLAITKGSPRRRYFRVRLLVLSAGTDRLDAARMLRIMTLGCRFCGSNSMCGEVHKPDCIYATDPTARRVWLRRGARVIE